MFWRFARFYWQDGIWKDYDMPNSRVNSNADMGRVCFDVPTGV